jgi:signal transduction histidine kinase
MWIFRARGWIGCACFAGLLLLTLVETAAAQPRRVLLLHSFGPNYPPWNAIVAHFREELTKRSPHPIDLYEASLQSERFGESHDEGAFIDYLRALFAERGLDLVVALGAPAGRFFLRTRPRIFPSVPLLVAGADERALDAASLTTNDTAVTVRFDHAKQIEHILEVLPDTANVVVALGASPLERFWLDVLRRAYQPLTNRVAFEWLNELALEEMVQRVKNLPPRSAIYYATVRVDARGVPQEEDRVLARLSQPANAPIFTYIDNNFGNGIVGGPMLSTHQLGLQGAAAAIRILSGESPGSIKTPAIDVGTPVYDWRELQRWNIGEHVLPSGSIVQFRQPTTWETYRAYILLIVVVFVAQAVLVQWLLYERWKRRRSESAAHELSGQLIHAQEQERARLARELHDDVTQRLALLAIEAGREERKLLDGAGGSVMKAVREGLGRLSEDVHALSYRLHPSILEDLGLVEALKSECERFAHTSPIRLEMNASDIPEPLPRDVALCLFRIAQEGLRNVARHAAGATRAELSLTRVDGGLRLVIRDDGAGFDPARRHERVSLGHASMRQRTFLLGGKVVIDGGPGRGTIIEAWVPLKGGSGSPAW